MKFVVDTNVYVEACRFDDTRARFRATFFPLPPATYLAAVVAYELRVNAADRPSTRTAYASITTSAFAISRLSNATPSSEVRLSVMSRFPGFAPAKT